jgi:predicted signal transduction protein with EAL and GGDEF domain
LSSESTQIRAVVSGHADKSTALVVDDDLGSRLIAATALGASGFVVQEAADGREALKTFERTRPDIVLLDIMMPEMSGYDVCKAIRRRPDGAATPIIIMTSLDDCESVQRAYDLGATDFIIKPFNGVLLAHRASYVLRTHRHYIHFDDLTRLPKRDLFLEQLGPALARARRHERITALLLLGIDNFERVNASFGHVVGDRLLREFGLRLAQVVRTDDITARNEVTPGPDPGSDGHHRPVSRLGGDEFAVALTEIQDPKDAGVVASRIAESLATFNIDGRELSVTVSIGISVFPMDGEEPQALLKHAGVAMRHAKTRGRNGFQYYTETLNSQTRRRFSLEASLRRALEREEFQLNYQPQVELAHSHLIGMEAVTRWYNDDLGSVSPGEFIPIAEETGLIRPMTEWILHTACGYASDCHRQDLSDLTVSINLSAAHFKEKDLAANLSGIVEAAGLASRYVKLELTESALFKDMDRAIRILDDLRNRGFEIAVDDFGTGYSSLNYLTRLPISMLKIDQSFVRNAMLSAPDAAVVKVIIGLSQTLQYNTVAEGVESIDQLDFLTNNGCDIGQGFVFSRPLSGPDFLGWAERWKNARQQSAQPDGERVTHLIRPVMTR